MDNKKLIYIIIGLLIALVILGFLAFKNVGHNHAIETKKKVEHSIQVNMEPEPLERNEQVSSLDGYGSKGALADNNLTITDMLTYAVQDEYLAHGEYKTIMDKFGEQRPYANIMSSEETHLSYLKELYTSYGMEFPSDTSVGHIVVPSSLLEAAQTGVQAEIDNIAMYEKFLTYGLPDSVKDVFTSLKDASKNHLDAFQKQVDKLS